MPDEEKELLENQALENENAIGELLEDVDPVSGEIAPEKKEKTEEPPVPEVKPTPVGGKTEETKEEPKVDDLDEELEKIQPPRKGSSASDGYKALKEVAKRERAAALLEKQQREERDKKITELEDKLKTPTIPEDVKKELEQLRQLRRERNIEDDPEFQQKFTAKLQQSEQEALGLLVEAGLSGKTAEWVKKRGGIIAMSVSKTKMPDGEMTEAQWVEEVVLPKTPFTHRGRVEERIARALDLSKEMEREIEAAKSEAPQRQQAQMDKVQKEFKEGVDEAIAALGDLAKIKDIPTDATAEQKAKLEKHNERVKKAEASFTELMQKSQNPKEAAKVLVLASRSGYFEDEMKDKDSELSKTRDELKALQEKYEKVKSSGSHSRQGTAPTPSTKPQEKSPLKVSDEDALEQEYAKLDS